MVTSSVSNDFKIKPAQGTEILTNGNTAIKQDTDFINFQKPESTSDYNKILSQTTMSMQKFANSHYKNSVMLEPKEIDQIKDSLNNFSSNDSKVSEFKKELLNDLTNFQNQIKTNYVDRITEYRKQQQLCEKQIKVLEFEKNKLIMDRLSKISWPYDEKTKEYDNKIATLTIQSQQYAQKAQQAQQMRPAANEKDILLYQLKLKEKYSTAV